MSVGLMINERELINDRMIHSGAHCPSKFSGGSRLLSVVPVRIVAAPPRRMKRSKIFRGRKKKRRRKEGSSGWDNGDFVTRSWKWRLRSKPSETFTALNDNKACGCSIRFLFSGRPIYFPPCFTLADIPKAGPFSRSFLTIETMLHKRKKVELL